MSFSFATPPPKKFSATKESDAMRYLMILLPIACATGFAAPAQPAFDCGKADSSVEKLICEDTELAMLDQRLTDIYGRAMDSARALEAGADEAAATLRATQRGWIKGRDECWKATDMRDCAENAYLDREGQLVSMWMLDTPTAVVSYECDGNPANEVTVFYFDTKRPSIRVEYGDSIKTGTLQPAASGSKYGLGFGAFFWNKGTEALFAFDEGTSQTCKAVR